MRTIYAAGKSAVVSVLLGIVAVALACPAWGAAPSEASDLAQIKREIREIKETERRERERDDRLIEELQKRVDAVQSENQRLQHANQQLQAASQKRDKETSAKIASLKQEVSAGPSSEQFGQLVSNYLGSHTFTVTGAAGFNFIYDQQNASIDGISHQSQNTFLFDWEPMILYRPTDWILFEGVLSGSFGQTGTGTDLSTADFQLFPNDYLTIVAGLFDQPFGDWYENQSPMWVNRFITAPLPFGVEPVIPPGEIGIQLRGGVQWGKLGQDVDYTVWAGDGPSYSQPVLGAALTSPTAVAYSQTNGKSIGARIRFYPLPLEAELGRLELGASTYNGKWFDGLWLNAWGLDFNYFIGSLQTRGAWVQAYRQMPDGAPADNRQGWYIQIGYFLNGITVPFLPAQVNTYVQRLEPLIRYSGVNQHAVAIDDITGATGVGVGGLQTGLIPDFGLSGSPALWAPHAREVALGLDYWIAPSIVWQNEFDIELPHAGGYFVAGDGSATPAGAIPNDRAFLSQFTIGF